MAKGRKQLLLTLAAGTGLRSTSELASEIAIFLGGQQSVVSTGTLALTRD